jgi:hypothetical protein
MHPLVGAMAAENVLLRTLSETVENRINEIDNQFVLGRSFDFSIGHRGANEHLR